MPLQREHLQFAFLFLTVPIQYFIVQQSGSSESTRTHQISTLINQVKETYNRWFRVDSWIKWLKGVLESKYETFFKNIIFTKIRRIFILLSGIRTDFL